MSIPSFLDVNAPGKPSSVYAINVPLAHFPPHSQFVGELYRGSNPTLAKLLPIYLFLASRDPAVKWSYELNDIIAEKRRKKKKKKGEEEEDPEEEEYISQADAMKESVKQHSEESISIPIEPLLDMNLKEVIGLRFWIISHSPFTLSQQLHHFCMDKRFSEGHAVPLGEQATFLEGGEGGMDQELREIQKNFTAILKEPVHEESLRRYIEEYITVGCASAPDIQTRYTAFIKGHNEQLEDVEERMFSLADVAFSPAWAMHINVQGVNPNQVNLKTYFDTEGVLDSMEIPCSFRSPAVKHLRDRTNFSLITTRIRQKLGHPHHSSLFPIQNSTFETLVYFSKESSLARPAPQGADAFLRTMNKAAEYCNPLSVFSPHPTRSGQFVRTTEFPEYDILDIIYSLSYDSIKKLTHVSASLADVKEEARATVHAIINSITEAPPADVYGGIIEYALALTGTKPVGRVSSAKAAIGEKKKKLKAKSRSVDGSVERHLAMHNDIDLRRHQNTFLFSLIEKYPDLEPGLRKRACYRAIDMLFKSKNIPETAKDVVEFFNTIDDIRFKCECIYSNLPIFQNALLHFNTMTSLRGTTHHADIQFICFASALSASARCLSTSECWPHIYTHGTASSGKSDCMNGLIPLVSDKFMKTISHSTALSFTAGTDNSYRIWRYEEPPDWLCNPNTDERADSTTKTALTSPWTYSTTALRQHNGDRDLCESVSPKDGLIILATGNEDFKRTKAVTTRFLKFNIESSREDTPGWSISDRSTRRQEDIKEYDRLVMTHKKIFHLCMLSNLVNKMNPFGMNAHSVEYGARLIESIIRELKNGEKVSPRLVEMVRKIAESMSLFKNVYFLGGSQLFEKMFSIGPKGKKFDLRKFVYKLWCNTYIGVDEVITSVVLTAENLTDMKHQRILSALSQLTKTPNAVPIFMEDYARNENPLYVRGSYKDDIMEVGIDKTQKCRFIADPQYITITCLKKVLAQKVGKILNQTLDERLLMDTIDIMCSKMYTVKKAFLEFQDEGEKIPEHVQKLMKNSLHMGKTYVIRKTIKDEDEELPVIVKERSENGKLQIKLLIDIIGKYKSGETNFDVKNAIEKVLATKSMSVEELEAKRFFGPPGSCRIEASNGDTYSIPSVYEPSKMSATTGQTVFPGRSMLTPVEYQAICSDTTALKEDEDEVIDSDFGIDNWIIERHWNEMKVPSEDRIKAVIPAIGRRLLLHFKFMKDDAPSIYPDLILKQEAAKIEKYISGRKKRKADKMQVDPSADTSSMAAKRRKMEENIDEFIKDFLPHFGTKTGSSSSSKPTSSLKPREASPLLHPASPEMATTETKPDSDAEEADSGDAPMAYEHSAVESEMEEEEGDEDAGDVRESAGITESREEEDVNVDMDSGDDECVPMDLE